MSAPRALEDHPYQCFYCKRSFKKASDHEQHAIRNRSCRALRAQRLEAELEQALRLRGSRMPRDDDVSVDGLEYGFSCSPDHQSSPGSSPARAAASGGAAQGVSQIQHEDPPTDSSGDSVNTSTLLRDDEDSDFDSEHREWWPSAPAVSAAAPEASPWPTPSAPISGPPPLEVHQPQVPESPAPQLVAGVLASQRALASRLPDDLQAFEDLVRVYRTGSTAFGTHEALMRQWTNIWRDSDPEHRERMMKWKPKKASARQVEAERQLNSDQAGLSLHEHTVAMPRGLLQHSKEVSHLTLYGSHVEQVVVQVLARIDPLRLLPDAGEGEWPDPVFTPGVDVEMAGSLASEVSHAWAVSDTLCMEAFKRQWAHVHPIGREAPSAPPPTPLLRRPHVQNGRFKAYVMAGEQAPLPQTLSEFQNSECARQSLAMTLPHGALPLVLSVFIDGASTGQRGAHELTPITVRCLQLPTAAARSTSSAHLLAMLPSMAALQVASDPAQRNSVKPRLVRHRAFQNILEQTIFRPLAEIWANGGAAVPVPVGAVIPLRNLGVTVKPVHNDSEVVFIAKVLPVVGLLSLDMKEAWRVFNLTSMSQIGCRCHPKKAGDTPTGGVSASVAAMASCTPRSGQEHTTALRARRLGQEDSEHSAVLADRKFPDDVSVVERYWWLFPGGSAYKARPPDRLHVFAATLAGERVWTCLKEALSVQSSKPSRTKAEREQLLQERLRSAWSKEVDGTRLIGGSDSLVDRLLSSAMLSMEQRIGVLPHLAWIVGGDNSIVPDTHTRQLFQLLLGSLEVITHFLYVRPVSAPGDPCRISQWFGRLNTVYKLLSYRLIRRPRKRPRAVVISGRGSDAQMQGQASEADPEPSSVDYPKAHTSLHFGGALWWFGSLEAVDTDIGESFHTVVTSVWRSLNTGKGDLLKRMAQRVLLVSWYTAYAQSKAVPDSRTDDWRARCRTFRSARPINPDGTLYPTLGRPVRSQCLTIEHEEYEQRLLQVPCPGFQNWARRFIRAGVGDTAWAHLPAGTHIGGQPLPAGQVLQAFHKVKLRFTSGNANMVPLPAYLDVVVTNHFEQSTWRALEPVLALLCLAPAPVQGATRQAIGAEERTLILCLPLTTGACDAPGWVRIREPTADSTVQLMDCTSVRGESITRRLPSLLGTVDDAYLHHWLLAGLAGKQRQATKKPT